MTNWPGFYIGPDETWRRFMAGMSVTPENVHYDGSDWTIRPMTRYHLDRLSTLVMDHPSYKAADIEKIQAAVVATINTLGAALLGSNFRSITSSPIGDEDIAEILSTALAADSETSQ